MHVAKRCQEAGAIAVLIGNTEEGLISTAPPAAGGQVGATKSVLILMLILGVVYRPPAVRCLHACVPPPRARPGLDSRTGFAYCCPPFSFPSYSL